MFFELWYTASYTSAQVPCQNPELIRVPEGQESDVRPRLSADAATCVRFCRLVRLLEANLDWFLSVTVSGPPSVF